jgi:quinol monooxygenase YgiN
MPPQTSSRIRHAVVFRLAHPEASEAEAEFLRAARELAAIDGVEAFELAREVSPKNPFTFGLSMEFLDQQAYDAYNGHPDHVRFVAERWQREVAEFLEIDTVALPPA